MFKTVCYHSSLNQELNHLLQIQQKKCLAVILSTQYKSYRNSLSPTNLPSLFKLREEACLKWAVRAQKSPLHRELFPLVQKTLESRSNRKFIEYKCKTNRFYNSAVPYGKCHPGRELTAIELENFWFALKPINMWIYFKNSCPFVYVSIFLAGRSLSILFTSFTC